MYVSSHVKAQILFLWPVLSTYLSHTPHIKLNIMTKASKSGTILHEMKSIKITALHKLNSPACSHGLVILHPDPSLQRTDWHPLWTTLLIAKSSPSCCIHCIVRTIQLRMCACLVQICTCFFPAGCFLCLGLICNRSIRLARFQRKNPKGLCIHILG